MPPQRLRVVPFWQIAGRRAGAHAADADRPERDGPAGADDRVREHRGARAGARRVAARRNRRAAGARRDADADRPPADCREPRARGARRAPRRPARAARRSRCSSATPSGSPRRSASSSTSSVDSLVIGFAVLVACGSALVFGFVPALQSSRVDLVSVINEDASPRGAARGRLRAGLVVAQVAVSLLLLVGAGLATRSLDAARRANPGFDPSHVTAIDAGRQAERLRRSARPRVLSPAAGRGRAPIPASNRPRSRRTHPLAFLETPRAARGDRGLRAASRRRSGVHVEHRRSGLLPHAADPAGGRARVRRTATTRRRRRWRSSTHTLAQRFWGGAANAIGKRIRVGDGDWRTVVGVAADVKYLADQRSAAARTSTCRSCSRTGRP